MIKKKTFNIILILLIQVLIKTLFNLFKLKLNISNNLTKN